MTPSLAAISRGTGTALWRQIASGLEAAIRSGAFAQGSHLPTEKQLAAQFGVNRHTVRQAINRLAEAGLIRVEQGRGMFVAESQIDYALGPRTRFSENIATRRKQPARDLVFAKQVMAPAAIARALGVPTGSLLWQLETRERADDKIISVSSHYFPAALFPRIDRQFLAARSITGALKAAGVGDYRRRTTRISARIAAVADARILGIPRNRPVLVSETVNVDREGRPVEFVAARFVSDGVAFTIQYD